MPGLIGDVVLLICGIGVLYYGAEWLVRGSARLAGSLGISPIVVGLTVVSFGTSAPELVVGIVAVLDGNATLAIGNVMGSNLANVGLILGLTAVVRPLEVHARVVWREMPLMLLVTFALYPLIMDDLMISRGDGIILLMAMAGYLVFVFQSAEDEAPEILGEYEEYMKASDQTASVVSFKDVFWVVAGSACLVLGGYAIVEGAVEVAGALGISQVVIGLTVVAVGTSLPELAASLVAAMRDEADIAVGNVIGSNIFNVAGILGTAAVIEPIGVPRSVLSHELPAVLLMSLLLFPILRSGWRIRRWEGVILLTAYVAAGVFLL
ncbi:MAG: calcium/sodium antiporter [Gemmatimonadetes bacterium]|nr:calcium/sodium antiporter [Gemmatimonadota bacterium]